jgi:predicted XRE-type DNA-binding protein
MSNERYTISSGNVFADAGLPNAEERLARAELLYYIGAEIKRRGMTEDQAANLLGVLPEEIHSLFQWHKMRFSFEQVLQMIARLEVDIAISCQPAPSSRLGHVTTSLPQPA